MSSARSVGKKGTKDICFIATLKENMWIHNTRYKGHRANIPYMLLKALFTPSYLKILLCSILSDDTFAIFLRRKKGIFHSKKIYVRVWAFSLYLEAFSGRPFLRFVDRIDKIRLELWAVIKRNNKSGKHTEMKD